MERRSRSRKQTESNDALAIGAVLAGAAALAGLALAASGAQQRQKVKVAGIDLSGIDLRRPFFVDFSVGPHAPIETRWEASRRLKAAVAEFIRVFPGWIVEPDVQFKHGRFVMAVTPIEHPAQQVTRRLFAP